MDWQPSWQPHVGCDGTGFPSSVVRETICTRNRKYKKTFVFPLKLQLPLQELVLVVFCAQDSWKGAFTAGRLLDVRQSGTLCSKAHRWGNRGGWCTLDEGGGGETTQKETRKGLFCGDSPRKTFFMLQLAEPPLPPRPPSTGSDNDDDPLPLLVDDDVVPLARPRAVSISSCGSDPLRIAGGGPGDEVEEDGSREGGSRASSHGRPEDEPPSMGAGGVAESFAVKSVGRASTFAATTADHPTAARRRRAPEIPLECFESAQPLPLPIWNALLSRCPPAVRRALMAAPDKTGGGVDLLGALGGTHPPPPANAGDDLRSEGAATNPLTTFSMVEGSVYSMGVKRGTPSVCLTAPLSLPERYAAYTVPVVDSAPPRMVRIELLATLTALASGELRAPAADSHTTKEPPAAIGVVRALVGATVVIRHGPPRHGVQQQSGGGGGGPMADASSSASDSDGDGEAAAIRHHTTSLNDVKRTLADSAVGHTTSESPNNRELNEDGKAEASVNAVVAASTTAPPPPPPFVASSSLILEAETLLALGDGTVLGYIDSVLGRLDDPLYAVALDAPRLQRSNDDVERVMAAVHRGLPVFAVLGQLIITSGKAVQAVSRDATDASFVGDVERPPGMDPDFSDDEKETAHRKELKAQRETRLNALAAALHNDRRTAMAMMQAARKQFRSSGGVETTLYDEIDRLSAGGLAKAAMAARASALLAASRSLAGGGGGAGGGGDDDDLLDDSDHSDLEFDDEGQIVGLGRSRQEKQDAKIARGNANATFHNRGGGRGTGFTRGGGGRGGPAYPHDQVRHTVGEQPSGTSAPQVAAPPSLSVAADIPPPSFTQRLASLVGEKRNRDAAASTDTPFGSQPHTPLITVGGRRVLPAPPYTTVAAAVNAPSSGVASATGDATPAPAAAQLTWAAYEAANSWSPPPPAPNVPTATDFGSPRGDLHHYGLTAQSLAAFETSTGGIPTSASRRPYDAHRGSGQQSPAPIASYAPPTPGWQCESPHNHVQRATTDFEIHAPSSGAPAAAGQRYLHEWYAAYAVPHSAGMVPQTTHPPAAMLPPAPPTSLGFLRDSHNQ